MRKKNLFRRILSGALGVLFILQALQEPVYAIKYGYGLASSLANGIVQRKSSETKESAEKLNEKTLQGELKLTRLEQEALERLEKNSFELFRGPLVIDSKNEFEAEKYIFVEKDENGDIKFVNGAEIAEFTNIKEIERLIKKYRLDYKAYEAKKTKDINPTETFFKINYKQYDEFSIPIVINDLEGKFESTKNQGLTLKTNKENPLIKEIYVNSLEGLERLKINFKTKKDIDDLDILKVEKQPINKKPELDDEGLEIPLDPKPEEAFKEVLEEGHKDGKTVTSLSLDELDTGYKYIFTLSSKEVKNEDYIISEISQLQREKDSREREIVKEVVEELGKPISDEKTVEKKENATETITGETKPSEEKNDDSKKLEDKNLDSKKEDAPKEDTKDTKDIKINSKKAYTRRKNRKVRQAYKRTKIRSGKRKGSKR